MDYPAKFDNGKPKAGGWIAAGGTTRTTKATAAKPKKLSQIAASS